MHETCAWTVMDVHETCAWTVMDVHETCAWTVRGLMDIDSSAHVSCVCAVRAMLQLYINIIHAYSYRLYVDICCIKRGCVMRTVNSR